MTHHPWRRSAELYRSISSIPIYLRYKKQKSTDLLRTDLMSVADYFQQSMVIINSKKIQEKS